MAQYCPALVGIEGQECAEPFLSDVHPPSQRLWTEGDAGVQG